MATEVLAGMESELAVRREKSSQNVLGVLTMINDQAIDSTDAITRVYGDVKELVDRVNRFNDLHEDMEFSPSPYLMHLNKMREIEEEITRL